MTVPARAASAAAAMAVALIVAPVPPPFVSQKVKAALQRPLTLAEKIVYGHLDDATVVRRVVAWRCGGFGGGSPP